jgi:hypothetical protein
MTISTPQNENPGQKRLEDRVKDLLKQHGMTATCRVSQRNLTN